MVPRRPAGLILLCLWFVCVLCLQLTLCQSWAYFLSQIAHAPFTAPFRTLSWDRADLMPWLGPLFCALTSPLLWCLPSGHISCLLVCSPTGLWAPYGRQRELSLTYFGFPEYSTESRTERYSINSCWRSQCLYEWTNDWQHMLQHISMMMPWILLLCSFRSLCWVPASLSLPSPTLKSQQPLAQPPPHTRAHTHTGQQNHPRPPEDFRASLLFSMLGSTYIAHCDKDQVCSTAPCALSEPGLLSLCGGGKSHLRN